MSDPSPRVQSLQVRKTDDSARLYRGDVRAHIGAAATVFKALGTRLKSLHPAVQSKFADMRKAAREHLATVGFKHGSVNWQKGIVTAKSGAQTDLFSAFQDAPLAVLERMLPPELQAQLNQTRNDAIDEALATWTQSIHEQAKLSKEASARAQKRAQEQSRVEVHSGQERLNDSKRDEAQIALHRMLRAPERRSGLEGAFTMRPAAALLAHEAPVPTQAGLMAHALMRGDMSEARAATLADGVSAVMHAVTRPSADSFGFQLRPKRAL